MLNNVLIADCAFNNTFNTAFEINRPNGPDYNALVYFFHPMKILIDGDIIDIKYGAYIIMEKHKIQYYRSLSPTYNEHYFHFDCDGLLETMTKLNIPINTPFWLQNPTEISEYIKQVIDESYSHEVHKDTVLTLLVNLLFYKISTQLTKNFTVEIIDYNTASSLKVLRANILNNVEHDWHLDEMAQSVNFSTSHFCKLYKDLFGETPKNELLLKRMEKAKYLLTTTKYTIEQISEILCYKTTNSFINAFKKHSLISPGIYRKNFH